MGDAAAIGYRARFTDNGSTDRGTPLPRAACATYQGCAGSPGGATLLDPNSQRFTRLVLDRPEYGPQPEPWRGELTEIIRILVTASQFEHKAFGDRLGGVAAEVGTAIAERAGVDVAFEWASHDIAAS